MMYILFTFLALARYFLYMRHTFVGIMNSVFMLTEFGEESSYLIHTFTLLFLYFFLEFKRIGNVLLCEFCIFLKY